MLRRGLVLSTAGSARGAWPSTGQRQTVWYLRHGKGAPEITVKAARCHRLPRRRRRQSRGRSRPCPPLAHCRFRHPRPACRRGTGLMDEPRPRRTRVGPKPGTGLPSPADAGCAARSTCPLRRNSSASTSPIWPPLQTRPLPSLSRPSSAASPATAGPMRSGATGLTARAATSPPCWPASAAGTPARRFRRRRSCPRISAPCSPTSRTTCGACVTARSYS